MIKIYDAKEIDFSGTHIDDVDVLSANSKQKINGLYSLEFSLPIIYAQEIQKDRIIEADDQFYRIQRIHKVGNEKEIVNVYAEGLFHIDMLDDFSASFIYSFATVQYVLEQLLGGTKFVVGACDDLGSNSIELENKNKLQVLNEIITIWKGELNIDGLEVSIKSKIGSERGVTFKKGENLKGIEAEEDISNVVTRIRYANKDGSLTGTMDSPYLNDYSNVKNQFKEFDADSQAVLDVLAYNYLYENHQPYINYKIDFADLYYTEEYAEVKELERVDLGDTVLIQHDSFEIDIDARILEMERDICERRNTTVVLGNFREDFIGIQISLLERVEKLEKEDKTEVINSIVEVTKETVISAETAHILNAWIKNLYVDYLETNFSAIDPRLTAPSTGTRDYIRVKDLNMDFITQEFCTDEVEELQIPNPSNLDELINVYYTAIGEHPDAYKYFTITKPKSIYPELTDEEENAFKVMVRKRGNSGTKMKICFDEITLSNGTKTIAPVMIWGAGDGTTGNKHPEIETEERCARGFIYKDQDGLKIQYFKSNTGELREVKLCDEGVVITPPITSQGETGGNGGSFYVSTKEPVESDGENGDVWFVVPNSGNDILSFVLAEQTEEGTIDNENNTIDIEVETGTNLNGLIPAITISEGATIAPESGTIQNFSSPFTYIVTAEDGTPKTWTVNVSVKASSLDTYPNTAISEHINDTSNLLSTTSGFAAATGDVIGLEITFCANNLKSYYDEFGGEYLDNVSFMLTFMNDDTGNILTYQVTLEASKDGGNGIFSDDHSIKYGSYFFTRKASTASCALTQQRVEGVVPSEFDGVYGWVSLDVDCMISQHFAPPDGGIWIYGYKILRNGEVVSKNDFGTTGANPSTISEGHQKIPYQLTPWERYGMSAPTGGV